MRALRPTKTPKISTSRQADRIRPKLYNFEWEVRIYHFGKYGAPLNAHGVFLVVESYDMDTFSILSQVPVF